MTPRSWLHTVAVCILTAVPVHAADTQDRLEITADYRYAAQHSEASTDAQGLACREAWRLAVINSPIYREHTASIIDHPLLLDLASKLADDVKDREIVERTQRGRTVSCRVRGYLPQADTVRLIRTQVAGSPPVEAEQNRALRIVTAKEEGGYVVIEFQALRRLDWLNTAYQGTLLESADIMVDFYDKSGSLIRADRHPARHFGTNDVLNSGMLGIIKAAKPLNTASYRVWVVK